MSMKKYRVTLTETERHQLHTDISTPLIGLDERPCYLCSFHGMDRLCIQRLLSITI